MQETCTGFVPSWTLKHQSSWQMLWWAADWTTVISCLFHSDFEIRKLQCIQNSLGRVVTHSSKFFYAPSQLKKLHWLLVKYRLFFKIGLITYKILKHSQPAYLSELIHPYTYSRNARHSNHKLKFLHIPTIYCRVHKSRKHFSNSFRHYAPALCNSFPSN